jgi:hypothetical protein
LKKQNVEAEYTARLQLLFLIVVVSATIGAFVLAFLYQTLVKPTTVDPTVLLPQHRIGLSPKPTERFTFVTLAFIVPIAAYWASNTWMKERANSHSSLFRAAAWLLPAILAVLFFAPFVGFDFSQALVSGKSMPPEHPLRFLGACLVVSAAWYSCLSISRWRRSRPHGYVSVVAWIVFISSMLLQTFAWRVLGEASINVGGSWWNSIDAVVYSVSQVVGGKTVLADLPTQYGLYAELIGPIFRIIGFSVLKFTLLCAFLQIVSLSAVFYVAQRIIREPLLKVTFGVALVMITFETSLWLIGINQPYFQYWPLRFFWPAISVLAFFAYTNHRSIHYAAIVSIIGAVGSLWNADSGLMIEVAFAAFLVGKWIILYLNDRRSSATARAHLVRALSLHIAIFAIVVSAMFVYMSAKADQPIHWSWLFEYQRLFYGLGFMMLPLPLRPHPWMPVLAVYLIGMMTAVASWARHPAAKQADLICYVAFLGLGLFLYYEGRSHVLNLISVCWPSFLLAGILADRIFRLVRAGKLPRINLCLPVVVFALVLFCCIPFARNIERLWDDALANYATRGVASDPVVSDELTFIRSHSVPGKQCLILSKRQGLYYALTETASPVVGPGYAELLTMRDRAALIRQLSDRRFPCVFIGVGANSEFDMGVDPLAVLKDYSTVAKSSRGSMLYLLPNAP